MPKPLIYYLDSLQNPKVKALIKLYNNQTKTEISQFVSEGDHFCQLANEKGFLRVLWLTSANYQKLRWKVKPEVKIYLINDLIAQKISQLISGKIIVGVCDKPKSSTFKLQNILMLDNLQDPGNLGTLMRSAAAFNFLNVVASPNTVSFYNPKVLRATQGLIFELNLVTQELKPLLSKLKGENYVVIGTFLHNIKRPLFSKSSTKPKVLLIGNEGQGLNLALESFIDENFVIHLANNVESLNAAVAGSIIMYQLKKEN